jgi:hypothetical protein
MIKGLTSKMDGIGSYMTMDSSLTSDRYLNFDIHNSCQLLQLRLSTSTLTSPSYHSRITLVPKQSGLKIARIWHPPLKQKSKRYFGT